MKMRLALMYLGRGSGTDHFIYSHAQVLSELTDLTCYLSSESTLLGLYDQLPCKVHALTWDRGYKNLIRALLTNHDSTGISDIILQDRPNIVLNTHVEWWGTVVHKKLAGRVPLAGVIHDVTPHPGVMGALMKLYDVVCPTPLDVAIALSDYTYRELILKYPKKKCISSRHGIFHSNLNIDPDKIASQRKRMLFLGNINEYKGVEVLVEAFEIVRRSDPEIKLDIVGRGRLAPSVEAKISELGIGRNNSFVPDNELKEIVDSHGVMILPYTSATQSGVAAIALGNGLPGIATSVGALPEQIVDGRSGIVVPPRDPKALAEAMLKIAKNGDVARRMSQEAARIGSEDYSWKQISSRLLDELNGYLVHNTKPVRG